MSVSEPGPCCPPVRRRCHGAFAALPKGRSCPDGARDDHDREDGAPLAAQELDPFAETNRYAIPLSALLGGSYVAAAEQVEVHPEPPPFEAFHETFPLMGMVDGD